MVRKATLQGWNNWEGELTDTKYHKIIESGMRKVYPRGLNKRFGSKFLEGYRRRQKTLEKSQCIERPKSCEYNNQDEGN